MTKKLTFDIKKKRLITIPLIILAILIGNYFVSNIEFKTNAKNLAFKKVQLYENLQNSNDINQDWNVVILAKVKSNNVLMKPNLDSFLVSNKAHNDEINANMTWSFNLFNIFNAGE